MDPDPNRPAAPLCPYHEKPTRYAGRADDPFGWYVFDCGETFDCGTKRCGYVFTCQPINLTASPTENIGD